MADEKLNRSTRTAQAVAAAVAVTSAYGVKVDNLRVFADAYSVRVHFHLAPIAPPLPEFSDWVTHAKAMLDHLRATVS